VLITVVWITTSSSALPSGAFPTSPSGGDVERWGKDPFLHLPEPSSAEQDDSSPSSVELQGVIAGPMGVVAILNHQIVRPGDRINGEVVLDITPNAVVLKRGQQVRRVVIRSFALP
jgi:hypothetical protein